jgi:hypothetical protein
MAIAGLVLASFAVIFWLLMIAMIARSHPAAP